MAILQYEIRSPAVKYWSGVLAMNPKIARGRRPRVSLDFAGNIPANVLHFDRKLFHLSSEGY